MSDSATTSRGGVGVEDSARGGERGTHSPSSPARLLSSPRPQRDAICANLIGYYGNSAPQPLARDGLRKAQPIRSCGRSRGPTPTPRRVGRGQEVPGGGAAWAAETRHSLQARCGGAAAWGHFRSSRASAHAPVRGPPLPSRGVTCKNRAFTWGAEPCRGIPACSPVPG